MSRVASEASIVAAHHQAARKRAAAAEARQPSGPFSSLLDSEAPASARDQTGIQPQPVKRASSTRACESRPDQRHPAPDHGGRTESAAAQSPPQTDAEPDSKAPGDAESPDACKHAETIDGGNVVETAHGGKGAKTANGGNNADAAETGQLPAPEIPPAAETQVQQPVTAAQADVAPVAAAAVVVTVADPRPATDPPGPAGETSTAVRAEPASATAVDLAVGAAANDTLDSDSATGERTKPDLDLKSAVQPRPVAKADAAMPSTTAAGQTPDPDQAQTDRSPAQNPAQTPRHAAQPGTADGPAAPEPAQTPQRTHSDGQATAAIDIAKPAVDGAPQLATAPHPAAHLANPTPPNTPAAHTAPATADAPAAPVPIAGLAVEIAASARSGRNRFEIRLDPPELGRIDVRLDVDKGGNVTSRLVVEKAETLDLLRRDAPTLERALSDAGLKTSENGLQFALRDQSFAGRDDNRPAPAMARVIVPDAELATLDAVPAGYARPPRAGGGIDIQV